MATFADERMYVGEPGSPAGVTSRPARPGDNLELYANGLGATAAAHAAGRRTSAGLPFLEFQALMEAEGS